MVKGQVEAGWYIPWLFSPKVFGVVNPAYADLPYNGLILIILWVPTIFLVLMGCRKAFRQDRGVFYLSTISIGIILVGYGILSFGQRTPESWGGYRSFKFFSYFLPLFIASGLILLRDISFNPGRRVVPLLFSLALALGIGSSAYACHLATPPNT